MEEKFKKEILKNYSGWLSSEKRGNLLQKTKIFNMNNNTNYWIETHQIGESYSWVYLAVREGGGRGKLVFVRNFVNQDLKKIFEKKMNDLTTEHQNTLLIGETKKKNVGEKNNPFQYKFF